MMELAKGNCVCKLCGMRALSKCPTCRSVFEQLHVAYTPFTFLMDGSALVLRVDNCKTPAQGMECVKELLALREAEPASALHPTWPQLACTHEWAFAPGHKPGIGCDHE